MIAQTVQTRLTRVIKHNLISVVLAVVVGLPVGWLTAMLLTPALWRAEEVLHMELAGHSGPADWVLFVVCGVVVCCLFLFFRFVIFARGRQPGS